MDCKFYRSWKGRRSLFIIVFVVSLVLGGCATSGTTKRGELGEKIVDGKAFISEISTTAQQNTVQVLIKASEPLAYTAVKHLFPPGVVLYFPGTDIKGMKGSYRPRVDLIKEIKVVNIKGKKEPSSRIEIIAKEDLPYEVIKENNNILVRFQKPFPSEKSSVETKTYSMENRGKGARSFASRGSQRERLPVTERAKAELVPATILLDVAHATFEKSTRIHVKGNGTISNYKTFKLYNPPRIVFDIFDIRSSLGSKSVQVNDSYVDKIRLATYPNRVRMVLDTKEAYLSSFVDEPVADGLIVHVGNELPPVKDRTAEFRPKRPAWVNKIDFEMLKDGRSRILVRTTREVRYQILKSSDKKIMLQLFNTKMPSYYQRPLITMRFRSAVDKIVPMQAKDRDTALIAVELREAVPFRLGQEGNMYLLTFEASSVPPKPIPGVGPNEIRPFKKEVGVEPGKERIEAPKGTERVSRLSEKRYTGQKISLDFHDADIRNVIRILTDISGQNIVIDPDVSGRITLRLKEVPWDQVLDFILKTNKLDKVVEGNIIRIARLSTLREEQEAIKAKEQAKDSADPLYTEYIPVNYAKASDIKNRLENIKSERGTVSVDDRTNMIIMKDIKKALNEAKELIKKLDIPTPQVLIEARIVEVTTSFSRELGIQWGGQFGEISQPSYPHGHYEGIFGDAGGNNYVVNLPISATYGGLGFTFGRIAGAGGTTLMLDARLLAMQSRGEAKIISSPRILTLDNKEAYIEQGTSIPYQKEEEGTISVSFVEAVLKLTVTPHITPDNRVSLKINAKKDSPDWANAVSGTPAIDKKEADTELLVNDGDTIVIGGIIKKNKEWTEAGLPWLSRIPILGWLFKSKLSHHGSSELLIFITPKIIRLGQV
nr:type IV pilus secretin family protein [Desulfobacterales bacterium]